MNNPDTQMLLLMQQQEISRLKHIITRLEEQLGEQGRELDALKNESIRDNRSN